MWKKVEGNRGNKAKGKDGLMDKSDMCQWRTMMEKCDQIQWEFKVRTEMFFLTSFHAKLLLDHPNTFSLALSLPAKNESGERLDPSEVQTR